MPTTSAYLADIKSRLARGYRQNLAQLLQDRFPSVKWWVEMQGIKGLDFLPSPMSTESANERLSSLISSDGAFLAGRFGKTEVDSYLFRMRSQEWGVSKKLLWSFINLSYPRLRQESFCELGAQSGFYPADSLIDVFRFLDLYSACAEEVDLLGSWLNGENLLLGGNAPEVTSLGGLEPFFVSDPWTKSLEGKTVLAIHPFAETIRTQYERKRAVIFENKSLLPEFQLVTIKAPITLNRGSYRTSESFEVSWFRNLSNMQRLMQRVEFDLAIIGAGAYGLPLGFFAKKIGRKAVVLGGATQLLFGIRGRRWEVRSQYAQLMNSHWVRPGLSETPPKQIQIEGGAYW